MPKIKIDGLGIVEAPDEYCDKYENVCITREEVFYIYK